MNKKDLQFIKCLLERIKPCDEQVLKAISYVNRDLAQYAACRGQLKDQYDWKWPY
jgi:hypothetical protein